MKAERISMKKSNSLFRAMVMFCLCIMLQIRTGVAFGADNPDAILHARGYNIIPSPQQVELGPMDVLVDGSWMVSSAIGEDIAWKELIRGAESLHQLRFAQTGDKKIILSVRRGALNATDDAALNEQGYVIKISLSAIEITGNSNVGLFYGVQSLLQLLRVDGKGSLTVPEGVIRDWPELQLRFVHWDTKNHLDKVSTLKEYIDRLTRLKVNMISFEIWDKFKFPSYPEVGVKEGFTPAQLQELVDYGLERHIQIVPNLQVPAHMQWILKHEKYAHLRADGSDYQACMCDPETDKLIFGLFQDVLNATKGVDYFHVSTDEVYYAGICKKCKLPYNEVNRSLAFVDFVNKAHDYLSSRGRRIIIWSEWPLMPEHVSKLPKDVINGVMGASYFVGRMEPLTEEAYITEENKRGIRQLVYTAQTASLAPINLSGGGRQQGLEDLHNKFTSKAKRGNPIGMFAAGWDDRGPHSELHWLGWAAAAQYAWSSNVESAEHFVADFMVDFYGPGVHGMVDVYSDMEKLANFYTRSWDQIVPQVPGDGKTRASYGYSAGKFPFPRPLKQNYLPQPALPFTAGLNVLPVYGGGRYKELVDEAKTINQLATSVIYRLEESRVRADRNQYNFRVLLALARFTRHHSRMFLQMSEIENHLKTAEGHAAVGNATAAVEALLFAHSAASGNIYDREKVIKQMKDVYSETRVPGHLTLEDRYFQSESSIGMEDWLEKLGKIILDYSGKNNLNIEPIQHVLQNRQYMGENTGE
jgi:hexosaminidase